MNRFMYAVRGGGKTVEAVERAGIEYAFDAGEQPEARAVTAGPWGAGGGVVLGKEAALFGYYPDAQEWRSLDKEQTAWVGLPKGGRLPTAVDLYRRRPLDGRAVKMANGELWQVPIARTLEYGEGPDDVRAVHLLPVSTQYDVVSGEWTAGEIVSAYRLLWDLAEEWWNTCVREAEAVEEGAPVRFTFTRLHEAALQALQFNYRVGPVEASWLGILNDLVCKDILDTLVDLRGIETRLKKKMLSASVSRCGGGA